MNIACCGLGVNSIAGIIAATQEGIIFDEIMFANTGRNEGLGERSATYAYMHLFNRWLSKHGQPEIVVLHSYDKSGRIITLYEEVKKLGTLPAIVFGFKTCSQRFKIAPQDKYINKLEKAKETWASGNKVTKWVFYDADEPHRVKDYSDKKFNLKYFLIEKDFGRYECEQIIIDSGLPLPPKSSCYYCPSMKPWQIIELYEAEPAKFWSAISLEKIAIESGNMTSVKGLGRDFSWWDLIVAYRYLGLLKRHPVSDFSASKTLVKLMKKIRQSKPKELKPRSSAKEQVCDLFTVKNDIPCGCYDS